MVRHRWTLLKRCSRRIERFRLERKASTAIEFAMLAPIFIGLLISVLETGIFFLAQQNLQAAAVKAGRLYLTGQAQGSSMTQSQLVTAICPSIQALFTCGNLMVDLQTYNSFSNANTSAPTLTYNAQGVVTNTWAYSPGTSGQIMVVRLLYQWPLISGPFVMILPNLGNGTSLVMGVTAFRVEPY
jgi:Flp pilus assembly protein TadG